MNMLHPIEYIISLGRVESPFRYLLSRLLLKTGLYRVLTIKTNGYKLHYYNTAISSELWINPQKRKYEMLSFIKAGDTIIDVGANIGTTVIPSALATGKTGVVLAFEAHPETFEFLRGNIKLNNLKNVTAFNFALGEKEGDATISDIDDDDQNHVMRDKNGKLVKLAPLDNFTKKLEIINLLKIDVEGYELFVLQGAEETLKKTKIVNIEISEKHFAKFGYSCSDVINLLASYNFECFREENGNCSTKINSEYIQSMMYENIIAKKIIIGE
ncbi:MAG: FkbM family methyltransferase [Verrucomicrobiota bacterium]|nr:FkbM family methyltransferase [Verrucomicrobiota bacterium]